MVETQEDSVDTLGNEYGICCPRCKSQNIILKEDKDGFFWIYLCNNCGYKGKEGDKSGCIDRKEPGRMREE